MLLKDFEVIFNLYLNKDFDESLKYIQYDFLLYLFMFIIAYCNNESIENSIDNITFIIDNEKEFNFNREDANKFKLFLLHQLSVAYINKDFDFKSLLNKIRKLKSRIIISKYYIEFLENIINRFSSDNSYSFNSISNSVDIKQLIFNLLKVLNNKKSLIAQLGVLLKILNKKGYLYAKDNSNFKYPEKKYISIYSKLIKKHLLGLSNPSMSIK